MSMLLRFLFSNLNFTLGVLFAFIFFTTGWLYIDSSELEKKNINPVLMSLGFFILALSSLGHATALTDKTFLLVLQILEAGGLTVMLLTLLKEPAVRLPNKKINLVFLPLGIMSLTVLLTPLTALLYLTVAFVLFKKIKKNLEKQLMPLYLSFIFLTISSFLNIGFLWKSTNIVFFSNLLSDFGLLWLAVNFFKIVGVIILAQWTLGYIRFRLASQIFISTVSAALFIFLVTTVFFTFLLFRNVEQDALDHLKTDVKLLQYSLESLQKESFSDAQSIAQNTQFLSAFEKKDKKSLFNITSEYLVNQNTGFLTVTDNKGNVLMRAEDKEKIGDNLSADPVVKSALAGHKLSTVVTKTGIILPVVQIVSSVPVVVGGKVAGSVSTGFIVDVPFVDRVKNVTGLDTTVFAGNRRAATTFLLPDNKSRAVGTIESNPQVISQVLDRGEVFVGFSQVLNQSYYSVYAPLKTYGDKTIGMLYVGEPETQLVDAANRSLALTFLGSVILMIVSVFPAYYIARYINEQMLA